MVTHCPRLLTICFVSPCPILLRSSSHAASEGSLSGDIQGTEGWVRPVTLSCSLAPRRMMPSGASTPPGPPSPRTTSSTGRRASTTRTSPSTTVRPQWLPTKASAQAWAVGGLSGPTPEPSGRGREVATSPLTG